MRIYTKHNMHVHVGHVAVSTCVQDGEILATGDSSVWVAWDIHGVQEIQGIFGIQGIPGTKCHRLLFFLNSYSLHEGLTYVSHITYLYI